MSTYCNDDLSFSDTFTEDAIATESSGANSSDEGNISEDEFRGFNIVPRVCIERFDINKYSENSQINHVQSKEDASGIVLQKCSVHLVRDNLDKLKGMYTRNLLLNNENRTVESELKLKCKICEKVYTDKEKLLNHQEKKHLLVCKSRFKLPKRVSFSDQVIIHEVKEYHVCRKCPKIFENYTALKVHNKRKHKNRKCYICNYCSKKFVDRMVFKVHIKSHCDVCGQRMPNKRKLMEHRRYVCNVIKKYPCKTCDEKYFRFMDLKEHSYDHLGTFYICDICKDQFQSQCEVAHHIQFLHSQPHPQNLYKMLTLGSKRFYVCRFCNESLVDEEEIKSHVSSLPDLSNKAMTGYKDFYFCNQCLKKFTTETGLLQHKQKHILMPSTSQEQPMPKSKNGEQTLDQNKKNPRHMQPKLMLENVKVTSKPVREPPRVAKAQIVDLVSREITKAVVDPVSKKTIISNHQCPKCNKYFSSNYCLTRHIATVHDKFSDLQCPVCSETFVWPALLYSHKCLRGTLPDMPPSADYLDDLHIEDDYMNSVDYEIAAPIVELTEYDDFNIIVSDSDRSNTRIYCEPMPSYKIVLQEVPIEF